MPRKGAPSYDDSVDRYGQLDDDERAEAVAAESVVRRRSTNSRWLLGEVPMSPGTELTRRSPWTGVAAVVLGLSVFGAIVHHSIEIAIAGAVLAALLLARGRGAARKILVQGGGDVIIRGGFWGRTVRLADFDWAAMYRAPFGRPSIRPSTTVVLHRRGGRHVGAKIIGVAFPTVSHRRTTISLSSMWRLSATGQRIPDNTMAEFFRLACRDDGMRVTRARGTRVWTAERAGMRE